MEGHFKLRLQFRINFILLINSDLSPKFKIAFKLKQIFQKEVNKGLKGTVVNQT